MVQIDSNMTDHKFVIVDVAIDASSYTNSVVVTGASPEDVFVTYFTNRYQMSAEEMKELGYKLEESDVNTWTSKDECNTIVVVQLE